MATIELIKQFADLDTDGTEYLVTADDINNIENVFLRKVIRHYHDGQYSRAIASNEISISKFGDTIAPIGFAIPSNEGEDVLFSQHENDTSIHDPRQELVDGIVVAHGWTQPVRVRAVVATPVFDSESVVPFPTFNMSPVVGYKLATKDDALFRAIGDQNRHNPSMYSPFRHYLYLITPYQTGLLPKEHQALSSRSDVVVFSYAPLFVDINNAEMLNKIKSSASPDIREAMAMFPLDYENERLWSSRLDHTSWLSGYLPFVDNTKKNIMLFFNDYLNEFNQVLSLANYNTQERTFTYSIDKVMEYVNSNSDYETLASDILRSLFSGGGYISKSQKMDNNDASRFVLDESIQENQLVYDSIRGVDKAVAYAIHDAYFSIKENDSPNTEDGIFHTYMFNQLDSGEIALYPNGLSLWLEDNGAGTIDEFDSLRALMRLNVPPTFNDDYRQLLTVAVKNIAQTEHDREIKRYYGGNRFWTYVLLDGWMSIPYDIVGTSSVGLSGKDSKYKERLGVATKQNYKTTADAVVGQIDINTTSPDVTLSDDITDDPINPNDTTTTTGTTTTVTTTSETTTGETTTTGATTTTGDTTTTDTDTNTDTSVTTTVTVTDTDTTNTETTDTVTTTVTTTETVIPTTGTGGPIGSD